MCGDTFQQTAPAPFAGLDRELAVALGHAVDSACAMMER